MPSLQFWLQVAEEQAERRRWRQESEIRLAFELAKKRRKDARLEAWVRRVREAREAAEAAGDPAALADAADRARTAAYVPFPAQQTWLDTLARQCERERVLRVREQQRMLREDEPAFVAFGDRWSGHFIRDNFR